MHLFTEPDPVVRDRLLHIADICVYGADMYGMVANGAVRELVAHWASQIGHGFDGDAEVLLDDIEAVRAAVKEALDALADYVIKHPVPGRAGQAVQR